MLWLVLVAMVPVAAVVWLVWCGGRWRTAGWVLGHLLVAISVFSVIATVVAESKSTVCYNGPCTEHTAALLGGAAVLVLSVVSIVAAVVAALMRNQRAADRRRLRVRPWVVAGDVLVLGVLAAGAVAYGNHLGTPTVATQPVLRSSQVTHPRYGRQASLSSASFASSGSSSRP